MSFIYKPAVQENTAVLVGIAGPSGGGKTFSALRLARGLTGPQGRIAFVDTEARRGLHYARKFTFDHAEFSPPFTPERYREAIEAAEAHVGPGGAIVIDSMTHEWSGDGGCQDIHDEAVEKMCSDETDIRKRAAKMERVSALGWRDAKLRHKRMMSRLLQCRAHLIFCLRAEEKIKFEKIKEEGRDGRVWEKTVIVPIGWQPICEKNFMFEMTCSFMLSDLANHLATPIKLQSQHKPFFPLNTPIDERCGEQLAAWAAGGDATKEEKPPTPEAEKPNGEAVKAVAWCNAKIRELDSMKPTDVDGALARWKIGLAKAREVSPDDAMAVTEAAEMRRRTMVPA